eukprot:TRINITY_DN7168_c0_g1_i3.p2 TRINITY_DN7168_c0_g1~~TRINITY_DN7168_c0_g1_i3.p2  ORF type:complete len:108 (-),score=17.51 TRINITY_DN7168_c0_g1_i3:598-921(-)
MLALSDDFDLYSQVLLSKSFFVSKSVSLCYLCQLSTYWIFFFFNDTATTEIYTLHIVGSVRCVQETGQRYINIAIQELSSAINQQIILRNQSNIIILLQFRGLLFKV